MDVNTGARPLSIKGSVFVAGIELTEREVRAHLAPLLAEIADQLGLETTLKLADTFGGVRLYIAINPSPASDIAACIGLDKARDLGRCLGSGIITLPTLATLYRFARDVGITREHVYRHVSCRELAMRYRLSERRVWEILSASRDQGPVTALGVC